MSPKTERVPKYIERLLAGGWEWTPGEVVSVAVLHDDDCAHWRGGVCDCEPEVKMQRVAGIERREKDR